MITDAASDHTQTAKDAVQQVATDVADVIRGYDTMLNRAEDDLKPMIERLHTMHVAHYNILTPHLEAMGLNRSDAGSAMGLVHSTVATVRDWAGALDQSALPQILDGERMIVDTYTNAIGATDPGSALNRVLEDQRAAVRAQIAALKN